MPQQLSKEKIEPLLIDLITGFFGLEKTQLTSETPLFSSALLSSIQLIQIVMLLEERFRITISAFDVGLETFNSVDAISDFIIRQSAIQST